VVIPGSMAFCPLIPRPRVDRITDIALSIMQALTTIAGAIVHAPSWLALGRLTCWTHFRAAASTVRVVNEPSAFSPDFATPHSPDPEHNWFCVHESTVLVGPPDELGLEVATTHFLGLLNGVPCWAADVNGKPPLPFTPLMGLFGELDESRWIVAGRAVQLVAWDRTHRFCGRCGEATEISTNDRSRRCPACTLLAYPRLAPAVIMAVTRGTDEVLLGRNVNFPGAMFSCLAGFVEPGETLEQAVVREIREEVGVCVRPPRYVASQPWPFPHSLMIGFTAEWESGEIEVDPTEIAEAHWFTRETMPTVPGGISIAGRLIRMWVEGGL
jgi:NAD+ diphosphatase